MSTQHRSQSRWLALPLIGFFVKEWQVWCQQQSQPIYRLVPMPDNAADLPPYPVDMSPMLALPHGILNERGVPYNTQTEAYPAAYQPTTIAQYALAQWNAYLATGDEKHKQAFLIQAHWFVEHETRFAGDAGGWPIPFPSHSYDTPESWLSALTQGNVISVLIRAYRLTGKDIFLQVACRAIRTFELDIRDGGVSTSIGDDGIFFEEVAIYPATHILNGYILALFGLYDYISLTGDIHIDALIRRSLVTLHTLIDRYDTGYWSCYDLYSRHLATPFYHALHVTLLQALARYSGCLHCSALASRWAAYKYKPGYFIAYRIAVYRSRLRRKLSRMRIGGANHIQTNVLMRVDEASTTSGNAQSMHL
jgi:heparosan-N-sulfate-glucuronate 5-epimerase